MAKIKVRELGHDVLKEVANAARFEHVDATERGMLVTGPESEVSLLMWFIRTYAAQHVHDETVINVLLGDVEPGVMDPQRMLQLRSQAAARSRFIRDVALLDSAEVGELLGSEARNTSAMASRLKREGKLFAIPFRGVDYYPAAQIADGEPSSAIPRILEAFSGDSPWTVALWLNAPSGWLDGEKPIDFLVKSPDRVVRAAQKANEAQRF